MIISPVSKAEAAHGNFAVSLGWVVVPGGGTIWYANVGVITGGGIIWHTNVGVITGGTIWYKRLVW